jgi:hypothetical protein
MSLGVSSNLYSAGATKSILFSCFVVEGISSKSPFVPLTIHYISFAPSTSLNIFFFRYKKTHKNRLHVGRLERISLLSRLKFMNGKDVLCAFFCLFLIIISLFK